MFEFRTRKRRIIALTIRHLFSKLRSIGFITMNTCWFLWIVELLSFRAILQKYWTWGEMSASFWLERCKMAIGHLDFGITKSSSIRKWAIRRTDRKRYVPNRVCPQRWTECPRAGRVWMETSERHSAVSACSRFDLVRSGHLDEESNR